MNIKNNLLLLFITLFFINCGTEITTMSSSSSESKTIYQIPENYTGEYTGILNRAINQTVNETFYVVDFQNDDTGEVYVEVFFSWCYMPENLNFPFITSFKFDTSNHFIREAYPHSLTYYDRISGDVVLKLIKGEQSMDVFMDIEKHIDAPCNFNGTMEYKQMRL